MKQTDSVFSAICEIRGASSFTEAVELTDQEFARVLDTVTEMIQDGTVDFSEKARAKYDTPDKVRSYVRGMIKNHLKKDRRLNGGVRYQPKNPGSRVGSSDPVVKNLRRLRSTLSDEEQIAAVDQQIAERIESLKAERGRKVEIDVDQIPDELRHLVPGQ